MGKVVKKISSVFTGKKGGGETKSTETSNNQQSSTNSSESWLQKNPQYQALEQNALNEAQGFNMPQYQLAGENDNIKQALAGLSAGTDTQEYKDAAAYLKQQGMSQQQLGQQNQSNATNILDQFKNMSQDDYRQMVANEYDNDLVRSQISGATQDINDQRDQALQGINQRASTSGAMGSSRAGVASGVAIGKALNAVGNASVQYRTAEEANAANRLNSYMNLRTNTANSYANIGQAQQTQGLNQYNQGMGYLNQANQLQTQNYQNQLTAGQLQRSMDQNALDVQRQNQISAQTPALQRLAMYNQQYLPMANLSTTGNASGTSSGTSTTIQQAPATGGNLLGGLMGMGGSALGGMFGGGMGASMGGMLGGAFGNAIH